MPVLVRFLSIIIIFVIVAVAVCVDTNPLAAFIGHQNIYRI